MRIKTIITMASGIAVVALGGSCFHNSGSNRMPEVISYNFHIRPILSDKCFKCHGPDANKRQAGLRLDIADSAYAPLKETKGAFAIVPGKPEESELYRRIVSTDTSFMMPEPDAHLGALSQEEIQLFRKWIEQGAKYETHWAFIPPQKATPPSGSNSGWARNEIDFFVLDKMEEKGLSPSAEADKERLLKRVSLDLTGLPPSVELQDWFLGNNNPDAYRQLVDRLLASPRYGEKMALHWLDVGRYADSYGYQDDNIRSQWPWRDWVIHAFNDNLPYDKFLTWQIAGDLLPGATKEQILATGFFRNHKYTEEGGVIDEEYRVEYLVDKTKTYSKGILGLTMECAQCHDHKYDPFSQKDYYSLLAFFNNTSEKGYEGDVTQSKPAKHPLVEISDAEVHSLLKFIRKTDTGMLTVSVLRDDTARKTYILNRGVYNAPTQEVTAQAIPAVMTFDEKKFSRNRLGLAQWTIDRNNPLTARVFVNQIWQEIFGRGIVKTTGDFGMQGELPSHPELLDWLAVDFMDHGWDIKRLVRQIVESATYRQSAATTDKSRRIDPENIFLSHAPRNRLAAELVRDLVLSSSGLLNPVIGGPSVKPYQPGGLWEAATSGRGVLASYRQDKGADLYRRGMYTFIKLTVPPPSMVMFDASNRDQCEVKRLKTNTPLQALIMMNDPTVLEASRVLAQRLATEKTGNREKLAKAFRLIICRKPGEKEMALLADYFDGELQRFEQKQMDAGLAINVGEYPSDASVKKEEVAALMRVINLIYNMDEAITRT